MEQDSGLEFSRHAPPFIEAADRQAGSSMALPSLPPSVAPTDHEGDENMGDASRDGPEEL